MQLQQQDCEPQSMAGRPGHRILCSPPSPAPMPGRHTRGRPQGALPAHASETCNHHTRSHPVCRCVRDSASRAWRAHNRAPPACMCAPADHNLLGCMGGGASAAQRRPRHACTCITAGPARRRAVCAWRAHTDCARRRQLTPSPGLRCSVAGAVASASAHPWAGPHTHTPKIRSIEMRARAHNATTHAQGAATDTLHSPPRHNSGSMC
jgi:hypothetical protein